MRSVKSLKALIKRETIGAVLTRVFEIVGGGLKASSTICAGSITICLRARASRCDQRLVISRSRIGSGIDCCARIVELAGQRVIALLKALITLLSSLFGSVVRK